LGVRYVYPSTIYPNNGLIVYTLTSHFEPSCNLCDLHVPNDSVKLRNHVITSHEDLWIWCILNKIDRFTALPIGDVKHYEHKRIEWR
jgi:hypothetical protein